MLVKVVDGVAPRLRRTADRVARKRIWNGRLPLPCFKFVNDRTLGRGVGRKVQNDLPAPVKVSFPPRPNTVFLAHRPRLPRAIQRVSAPRSAYELRLRRAVVVRLALRLSPASAASGDADGCGRRRCRDR